MQISAAAEGKSPKAYIPCAALLLSPQLHSAKVVEPNQTPLYSLRQYYTRLKQYKSKVVSFRPVQYRSSEHEWDENIQKQARSRLEGVEDDLFLFAETKTLGWEVRGYGAIRQYIDDYEKTVDWLSQETSLHIHKNGGSPLRKTQLASLALMLAGASAGWYSPDNVLEPLFRVVGVSGFSMFMLGAIADLSHVTERFDRNLRPHLETVRKGLQVTDIRDKKLSSYYSSNTDLKEATIQNLMGDFDLSQLKEDLRIHHILSGMPDPILVINETVRQWRAGFKFFESQDTTVAIDQFFFFDDQTQEPVLVNYVRLRRGERPAGRKPPKVRKDDRQLSWEPELKPIAVPGR